MDYQNLISIVQHSSPQYQTIADMFDKIRFMDAESKAYLADKVLLIRPHRFRSNEMTLVNNYFQHQQTQKDATLTALQEFDHFARTLKQEGIETTVVQDQGLQDTPDSVFPNNWISFHPQRQYIIYPLFAPNRRLQRKINVFKHLNGYCLAKDYSSFQNKGMFLQGTGSIVLDRSNKVAYAALSPRTDERLFMQFCQQNNYEPCSFKAYQTVKGKRQLIYHTNVMMWIGQGVCGVCLASIDDLEERKRVRERLLKSKRQLMEISQEQVSEFAGNTIMLGSQRKLIVMSSRAHKSLRQDQLILLAKFGKVVHCDLTTIELYGGGSARCLIAEIF